MLVPLMPKIQNSPQIRSAEPWDQQVNCQPSAEKCTFLQKDAVVAGHNTGNRRKVSGPKNQER